MGKRRRFEWTPQTDEQLRTMYANGDSWQQIASALGCSEHCAKRRVRELDLPPRNRRWSAQDDERLKTMIAEGMRVRDIAKAMGCTSVTIYRHLKKLGLSRRTDTRVWTPREDEFLRRNYGVRPAWVIGRALKRTTYSVYMRAQYLGLTRIDATKIRRPWTDEEVERAMHLLEHHTVHTVARKLGRTRYSIMSMLRKHQRRVTDLRHAYTLSQVADMLGRSESYIRKAIRRGWLRADKGRHQWLIAPKHLRACLLNHPDLLVLREVRDQERLLVFLLADTYGEAYQTPPSR